jgi:hypothetical protein
MQLDDSGTTNEHMSNAQPEFSIKACYAKAWKSFAKWWIPICLLAAALMAFQLGPRQLAKAESTAMSQTLTKVLDAFEQNDFDQMEELAIELNEAAMAYAKKLMTVMLYAAPVVTILSILLLCTSMMAVKNQRTRYSPGSVIFVAFVNFIVAFVKVLLIFLFFPLGFYIYIKLFFVSLLMLEEQQRPMEAIRESWKLTAGHFWPLFGMVAINGTLQFAMVPTIIGLIPASGFANTARAAAFTMLRATSRRPVGMPIGQS